MKMHEADETRQEKPAGGLALMYHAVGDEVPGAGADASYTVGVTRFEEHLDVLVAEAGSVGAARDLLDEHADGCVMITFDDGHLSNYTTAFPRLRERGLRADFFVNPATIGSPGFCTWAQLEEMAGAGMSIQSHGLSHTYFTRHSPDTLRLELGRSREIIASRVGTAVTLLAPPGGRCPSGLARMASSLGYRHVLGSRPGVLADRRDGVAPRIAIHHDTDARQLVAWVRLGRPALRSIRARHAVLSMAKWTLGDGGYERVRGALIGARGERR